MKKINSSLSVIDRSDKKVSKNIKNLNVIISKFYFMIFRTHTGQPQHTYSVQAHMKCF